MCIAITQSIRGCINPRAMQIAQIRCNAAKKIPKDKPVLTLLNILPPFFKFFKRKEFKNVSFDCLNK